MATLHLNPVFESIQGTLNGMVYYRRGSRQCARRHVIPYNPDTTAQRECRRSFAEAIASWQQLSPSLKQHWNNLAAKTGRKGYHLYISHCLHSAEAGTPCGTQQAITCAHNPRTAFPCYTMQSTPLPLHFPLYSDFFHLQRRGCSRASGP